jgi:hypothetical protein
MKWFKHEADDRNKLVSKLVRSKFGAEGYGILQSLKEIVAEYVEQDNISEWGMVDPLHEIETLAEECSTTPEKLKDFLKFCDEKNILEKVDNRLYFPDMLKRLDDFAARIKRQSEPTSESVRSKYDIKENKIKQNKIKENKEKKEIKLESSLSYLLDLPKTDLEEFIKNLSCNESMVKSKAEDLYNYCKAKGKVYKDYKAFLLNALKKDFGKRQQVQVQEVLEEMSQEVRDRNRQRIADMKAGMFKGMGHKMTDFEQNDSQRELMEQAKQL